MKHAGWYVLEGIMAIGWVACIATWVKGGCSVPRWVHALAACLFLAGIGTAGVLGSSDALNVHMALSLILAPPVAAYAGWLWMFGPWFASNE